MYPLARFLWVGLTGWLARRQSVLDDSVLTMRVWPQDIDTNLHMNNGRYLTLMDIGRLDWGFRTGVVQSTLLRHRWLPLAGAASIRFRRPLALLRAFRLHTRVLGWDEKWFYLQQTFEQRGQPAAVGVVRMLFRGSHGNVPIATVLDAIGHRQPSPPLPEVARLLDEVQKHL